MATQLSGEVMPITQTFKKDKAHKITEEERKYNAYKVLRQARTTARLFGIRQKRARERAEEEANRK